MMTLTHANMSDTTVQPAIDPATELLCEMSRGYRGIALHLVEPADELAHYGDKLLNTYAAALKAKLKSGEWYVADPIAAEALVADYKSKSSVAVRRGVLLAWFAAERAETSAIVEVVQQTNDAAKQMIADEHAAKKSASAESVESVEADIGPMVTITSDAAATRESAKKKSAKKKSAKKPAEPKAPRDKYEAMTLLELLDEVTRMFGHGTAMTSASALRYKLRRGEKQLASGQRAVFSVSAPTAQRVKLSVLVAQQAAAMLMLVMKLGNDVQRALAAECIAELRGQLAAHSEATRAAA